MHDYLHLSQPWSNEVPVFSKVVRATAAVSASNSKPHLLFLLCQDQTNYLSRESWNKVNASLLRYLDLISV